MKNDCVVLFTAFFFRYNHINLFCIRISLKKYFELNQTLGTSVILFLILKFVQYLNRRQAVYV